MKNSVHKIALAGMLATLAIAAVMIVQLRAQQPIAGDFRNAQSAEVRDAQGQVLFSGTFAVAEQDPGEEGEVERIAPLVPKAGGEASGEAEVEYPKDSPDAQEVEFKVKGASAGAVLTLVIDGKTVTSATADKHGDAEAEVAVKSAGQ